MPQSMSNGCLAFPDKRHCHWSHWPNGELTSSQETLAGGWCGLKGFSFTLPIGADAAILEGLQIDHASNLRAIELEV